MKKILIVTDDKNMGGVSILLEDILRNIPSKYKIDLLILNNIGDCFKDLPKNINIIYGTKFFNVISLHLSTLIKKMDLIKIVKKIYLIFLMKTGLIKYYIVKERKNMNLEGYDVEVAFKDGFTTTFAGYGDSKEKIQWLHSDYSKMDYLKNYRKQYIKLFNKIDKIVAVSEPVKKSFNNIYGQKEKTMVINNLIDTNKILDKAKGKCDYFDKTKFNIITVGRLHKDKNVDGLINVIYKLKSEKLFLDSHLTIIGDGDEMSNLVNLVNELDLNKEITFLGNQNNPYRYVKDSDLFVLASKHESFGNVVIEALVLNVPVLSSRVATIHEMLSNDYGLIVDNNNEALYEGLKELLLDKKKVQKYKNNLVKKYKYDNETIIKQIEKLFK